MIVYVTVVNVYGIIACIEPECDGVHIPPTLIVPAQALVDTCPQYGALVKVGSQSGKPLFRLTKPEPVTLEKDKTLPTQLGANDNVTKCMMGSTESFSKNNDYGVRSDTISKFLKGTTESINIGMVRQDLMLENKVAVAQNYGQINHARYKVSAVEPALYDMWFHWKSHRIMNSEYDDSLPPKWPPTGKEEWISRSSKSDVVPYEGDH